MSSGRRPRHGDPKVPQDPQNGGAILVEFALVLPLFLVLVFAIVQYGWTFYQVQETAHAVREGARVAAVGTRDTAGVRSFVQGKIVSASTTAAVTTCYSDTNGSGSLSVGDEIAVAARFPATSFHLPFLPFPSGLQIAQTTRTRTENVVPGLSDYPVCP